MTKPTREQIERLSSLLGVIMESVIVDADGRLAEDIISDVLTCYLAQEEELKQNCQHIMEMGKQLGILKTENQALKEALEGPDALERYQYLYKETKP